MKSTASVAIVKPQTIATALAERLKQCWRAYRVWYHKPLSEKEQKERAFLRMW